MPAQIGYFDTLKSVAGKVLAYLASITLTGTDGKTLTVEDNSLVNQDLTNDAGPTFDHVHLTSGQIGFPAAAVPSADANTLDDYEEGTWDAGFTPSGGTSITINTSYDLGTYTKVGRKVTITGGFRVTSVSSPTGTLLLTGLPFANSAGTEESARTAVSIYAYNLETTAEYAIQAYIEAAESQIRITMLKAGADVAMAASIKATSVIVVNATYFV